MSFNQASFGPISSHGNSDMPNIWTYRSTDTLSEIIGNDYFNKKRPLINDGDFISLDSFDGKFSGYFCKGVDILTILITPASLNEIIINQESDFPIQDDTTITLEDFTDYKMGSLVVTSKRFIVGDGSRLLGQGPFNNLIEYTGTGTMFTAANVSWILSNLRINCPNGTLFDDTGSGIFFMENFQCLSCENAGKFVGVGTSINSIVIKNSAIFLMNTSGLVIEDTFAILSIKELFLINGAGVTSVDWELATFDAFEIQNLELRGPVGSFGLRSAAGGVNIVSGSVGAIKDSTLGLEGTITPLTGGLTDGDPAYSFVDVRGVINSKSIGHTYVVTPALTNVVDGVAVQVAGTFTQGSEASQSSSDATGIITMLNRIEKRGNAFLDVDLSKQTGAAEDYIITVQKDAGGLGSLVPVDGMATTVTLAGGGSAQISISAPTRFIDGDEFFATIEGSGTSVDITATTQGFKITE